MILIMIVWLRHLLGWLVSAFHSRQDLILENLALRQQLLVLHAQRPRRRFTAPHKLFWVLLWKAWDGWKRPLILVTPRTVVDWHRAGFRLYWRWLSRIRSTGVATNCPQQVNPRARRSPWYWCTADSPPLRPSSYCFWATACPVASLSLFSQSVVMVLPSEEIVDLSL